MPDPRPVLYIEDNPSNYALVRKVLEATGRYTVSRATTGEEGLEAVARTPPDLILLDLDLPGIGGVDVARKLRANPATANTPIIAVSASVLKAERALAIDAGCNAFVEKPFDIVEFREVVDRVFASTADPS